MSRIIDEILEHAEELHKLGFMDLKRINEFRKIKQEQEKFKLCCKTKKH